MARELPTRTTGQTINASDMNSVQERSLQRYATIAAAPTTGISAGELAYDESTDTVYWWDGANWLMVPNTGLTTVATSASGSGTAPSTNVETDVIALAVGSKARTSVRPRLVIAHCWISNDGTNYGPVTFRLRRYSGGVLLAQTQAGYSTTLSGTMRWPVALHYVDFDTSATSYRLSAQKQSGANNIAINNAELSIIPC